MKWLLCVLFLVLTFHSHGQNLVPNPSFEIYLNCPYVFSTIEDPWSTPWTVQNWFRPTFGTSDYHNACAPGNTSVPNNAVGWQKARTGNAYAGCIIMGSTPNGSREFIQSLLTAPMIAGHEYYVSFWVSLAEDYWGSLVATDQIDAYLDTGYVFSSTSVQLDFLTPQIQNPPGNVLSDTANWMQVKGTYTASGGERCIVIGNFSSYADQSMYPILGDTINFATYYYIDDVCVFDMTGMQTAHDTTICGSNLLVLFGKDNMHSYLWNTGDTVKNISITQPGTYWVKSFADCVAAVDTFHVTLQETSAPLALDTAICVGISEPVQLPVAGTDMLWYVPGSNNGSPHQPEVNTDQPGNYTFYISQTINGCESEKAMVTVAVLNKPAVVLEDAELCLGETLEIGEPQEGVNFQWNTGAVSCCLTISEPGIYHVRAYNDCGEQEDEANISFYDCHCAWLPSAFSPNGDGLNDKFEIKTLCPVKKYTLRIYNRWGQMIFFSNDPHIFWDGKFNGTYCDMGTYFYQLEMESDIATVPAFKLKGDVTLIK